jgi:uncharacterized coiled-coil protein SlyX
MEDRISKLESLLTMQDRAITELNTEMYRQQQDLTRFRQRIELLEARLKRLEEGEEIGGNDKPPHW